ncbi:hypothetical protein [Nocardia vermiculata]|uniref:Uncharacterized protein n=1 Tax=Nocardia vermiculata TaxID=257274 RepID=A0A846Y1A2_9NOCA|nr:hypothetical protein [Nocardia vermiculata]NKY50349.1 hypothetical protein [Nocardia vermiculata]
MDDVTQLVKTALAATSGENEGTAVLSTDEGFVQWLGFHDAVRVEVAHPAIARPTTSWWKRRQQAPAHPQRNEKIAALTELGFAEAEPNYLREMAAGEIGWEQITFTIVSALREVLGISAAEQITVETF